MWMYGSSTSLEQKGCAFFEVCSPLLAVGCSPFIIRSCWASKALRDPCPKVPILSFKKRLCSPSLGNYTDKRCRSFQINSSEVHHHRECSDLDSHHINLRWLRRPVTAAASGNEREKVLNYPFF